MQTRVIWVKVAGVTFEGRQEIIATLHAGIPAQLKPEPENEYDENAIAVYVERKGEAAQKIGYVPRDLAAQFAPLLDGEAVIGKIFEITGGFEKWNGTRASWGVIVEFQIPDESWEHGIST